MRRGGEGWGSQSILEFWTHYPLNPPLPLPLTQLLPTPAKPLPLSHSPILSSPVVSTAIYIFPWNPLHLLSLTYSLLPLPNLSFQPAPPRAPVTHPFHSCYVKRDISFLEPSPPLTHIYSRWLTILSDQPRSHNQLPILVIPVMSTALSSFLSPPPNPSKSKYTSSS